MYYFGSFVGARPEPRPGTDGESLWELLRHIAPVVLVYGQAPHLIFDEHNDALRLMRQLDRLGRHRVRLRAVFCGAGLLDRSSLGALNCYLCHSPGLALLARTPGLIYSRPWHRYGWADLCQLLALRWTI